MAPIRFTPMLAGAVVILTKVARLADLVDAVTFGDFRIAPGFTYDTARIRTILIPSDLFCRDDRGDFRLRARRPADFTSPACRGVGPTVHDVPTAVGGAILRHAAVAEGRPQQDAQRASEKHGRGARAVHGSSPGISSPPLE